MKERIKEEVGARKGTDLGRMARKRSHRKKGCGTGSKPQCQRSSALTMSTVKSSILSKKRGGFFHP